MMCIGLYILGYFLYLMSSLAIEFNLICGIIYEINLLFKSEIYSPQSKTRIQMI